MGSFPMCMRKISGGNSDTKISPYSILNLTDYGLIQISGYSTGPPLPGKYKISDNNFHPPPTKSDDPAPACGTQPAAAFYARSPRPG